MTHSEDDATNDRRVETVRQMLSQNGGGVDDPYPILADLQRHMPIVDTGDAYFVTSFGALYAGYREPQFSRQLQAQHEMRVNSSDGEPHDDLKFSRLANTSMLINQDQPDHKRIRQILEVAFKPSRVTAWQGRIDAVTARLIEDVKGNGEFDFLRALAYPLPEHVICELMGVPHEDHKLWGAWADDIVGAARTYLPGDEQIARVEAAQLNFYHYFKELVETRKKNMGDDLVSLLIRAEAEGERLSGYELYGSIQMLITAGHETTANLIGNGMFNLLRFGDQYDRLRADPALVDSAVEEMLRYEAPARSSLPREAIEQTELDGHAIRPGCPIVLAINAVNRDPARFENPDAFDIARSPNNHVAFAVGPHFCLGNQLARMEARTMFRAIVTELPRYELVKNRNGAIHLRAHWMH